MFQADRLSKTRSTLFWPPSAFMLSSSWSCSGSIPGVLFLFLLHHFFSFYLCPFHFSVFLPLLTMYTRLLYASSVSYRITCFFSLLKVFSALCLKFPDKYGARPNSCAQENQTETTIASVSVCVWSIGRDIGSQRVNLFYPALSVLCFYPFFPLFSQPTLVLFPHLLRLPSTFNHHLLSL